MRCSLTISLICLLASSGVASANPASSSSKPATASAQNSSSLDASSLKNLVLLEKKYFEHTFDSDSIEDRVARIEQLVLGDATTGNPQDRINKLVSSLVSDGTSLEAPQAPSAVTANPAATAKTTKATNQNDNSKQLASNGRDLSNDPYANDQDEDPAAGQTSNYPHVTALEKEIIGQTYDGQPLNARLARLETKAFGAVSQLPDLSQRTDALERYAEKKLKSKPYGENPEMAAEEFEAANDPNYARNQQYQQQQGAPQQQRQGGGLASQIPKQVLQSLLGIPNLSPAAYAPRQTADYSYAPPPPQDDPKVFQSDPPPSSEQMLIRVGWCEVHVFGHTYAGMHLTQRLRQLNDAVRPNAAKQSDMQLMDDLDNIVSAVQAKRPHPDKAIGAKNAGVTQ